MEKIKKEYEPDDPFEMVEQGFKATPQEYDYMATCIIEEYALMGFNKDMIISIFRSPWYQLPHSIYKVKGEEYVLSRINELATSWSSSDMK